MACESESDNPFEGLGLGVIGVVIGCIAASGYISMLNLACFDASTSVEALEKIIETSLDEAKVRQAERFLPLRKLDMWLLSAIIFSNTLIDMVTTFGFVALFALDDELSALEAVASGSISSFVIFIFSGQIPMAYGVSRAFGAATANTYVLWVLVYATAPISWPCGKFLDYVLTGEDGDAMPLSIKTKSGRSVRQSLASAKGLKSVRSGKAIDLGITSVKSVAYSMKSVKSRRIGNPGPFRDASISSIMRPWPWSSCHTVGEDAILDESTLATIQKSGQDEVPVTRSGDKSHVVAILYTRDLLGVHAETQMKLSDLLAKHSA